MQNYSLQKHISKTFVWMFVGILLTALTAFFVSNSETAMLAIFGNPLLVIGAVIVELALVIMFSKMGISSMNPGRAKIFYIIYCIVSGLTFSAIFIVYSMESIWLAFGLTALYFGALACIGLTTNVDLSKWGTIAIIGIIVLVIFELGLMIFGVAAPVKLVTGISIGLFTILTAWDVQKMKKMYEYYESDAKGLETACLYSAFELYLDFINLFLDILKLVGKSKD